MYGTPKYYLFKEFYKYPDGERRTLFKSQRALATDLVNLEIGYKKVGTLNSFLSQIFRKATQEDSPKPMPHKLLLGIKGR